MGAVLTGETKRAARLLLHWAGDGDLWKLPYLSPEDRTWKKRLSLLSPGKSPYKILRGAPGVFVESADCISGVTEGGVACMALVESLREAGPRDVSPPKYRARLTEGSSPEGTWVLGPRQGKQCLRSPLLEGQGGLPWTRGYFLHHSFSLFLSFIPLGSLVTQAIPVCSLWPLML